MKKYHLYLWLTALVGLFAACSQDETADALQTSNESNRVTLTASLPDDFAQIGTRALPTATGHRLRCILEVWTQGASPVLKQRIEKTDLTGENVVFDFKIDQGSYDCLFWADFIATDAAEANKTIGDVTYKHYIDKYYITDDATDGLKAVVINTSNYACNTDARDAFFGVYPLTKGAAAVTNPHIDALTRPFAKLTIKEKDATNYGYCTGLTATYEVPNKFNVLDKSVEGVSTVQVTCNSKSSESPILFSDYIFTNAVSLLGSIELTFTGTDKELLPVTIPAGIPLKRNYKTNASGNLISEKPAPTNGVKLTVTMNTNWSSPDDNEDLTATVWDGTYPASETEAKEWLGTESAGANAVDGRDHVFTITTARQLAAMNYLAATDVTMTSTTSNQYYSNATYKLAADINLNNHPWTPIGVASTSVYYFRGIFDGQGHTIRGINIAGDSPYSGFIAIVSGVVKHLNAKGRIAPVYTGLEDTCYGGIAGLIYGADACVAFCSFEGTIAGTSANPIIAGGIAGWVSSGKILSCYSVVTDMTLGGTGSHSKGGIAGRVNNATIKGCYWQTLTGITEAYGTKTGNGTVDAAYFANAAGANAAVDAMNTATPTGYDYKWQAGTNGSYPVLVPNSGN